MKSCRELNKDIISQGLLDSFDYVLSDCDGVLWTGEAAVPGSPETIQALQNKGKKVLYVTNNSTKARQQYLEKCLRLGFQAQLDEIFSTSYCAGIYLQSLNFNKKVYVFGSEGITREFDLFGIKYLPIGPDPIQENWMSSVKDLKLDPDVGAVVVGFDEHISYPKLLKVASYLRNPDCLFIATNKDEQFPAENNLIIPGTGTFVHAIEMVTNRKATVLGKPSKFMLHCIKQKFPDLNPERCLMIGDRLNTDILLGTSNGLKTLLVLTGISSLEDVENHRQSSCKEDHMLIPDFYLPCLGDFAKLLN